MNPIRFGRRHPSSCEPRSSAPPEHRHVLKPVTQSAPRSVKLCLTCRAPRGACTCGASTADQLSKAQRSTHPKCTRCQIRYAVTAGLCRLCAGCVDGLAVDAANVAARLAREAQRAAGAVRNIYVEPERPVYRVRDPLTGRELLAAVVWDGR